MVNAFGPKQGCEMKQVEGAFFYATRTRTGQIGPNLPCHAPAEAWMKQLIVNKET